MHCDGTYDKRRLKEPEFYPYSVDTAFCFIGSSSQCVVSNGVWSVYRRGVVRPRKDFKLAMASHRAAFNGSASSIATFSSD